MLSFKGRLVLRWSIGDVSHKAILANLGHGTERFHICYQHRDPTRAQHARISHSTGLPGWQWGITQPQAIPAGIPGPQALPRGKTRRALQAAGAMDRLPTVNSFTLMEIPNAVWPRERIWSPFKGPSSEFPALAFSYHLSLPFLWVDLCRAAGLEDGVGVKREGALPEQCIPYITRVMVL